MVKVVVALVESFKVTAPLFTTHLSNTLPSAGASAVMVTTVPGSAFVMADPAPTEAVPFVTVMLYSLGVGVLAGKFTQIINVSLFSFFTSQTSPLEISTFSLLKLAANSYPLFASIT